MDLLPDWSLAVGLVCLLIAERRERRRKPPPPADDGWSPFDGFYSDRPHWRPPPR